MVSRQESARALLTPGEVMQLPPDEEIVMVAGHAPVRAQKLRYYEDANFTRRLLPPPVLSDAGYTDWPAPRADDGPNALSSFPPNPACHLPGRSVGTTMANPGSLPRSSGHGRGHVA